MDRHISEISIFNNVASICVSRAVLAILNGNPKNKSELRSVM